MNILKETFPYVHEPLNKPVQAIGGQYVFIKETLSLYQDRKILYLIGCALFDNTCCGTGGVGYAMVPGYIIHWKCSINSEGKPVSLLFPVSDADEQDNIQKIIIQKEKVFQVQFGFSAKKNAETYHDILVSPK
jgi:hypothetical protein